MAIDIKDQVAQMSREEKLRMMEALWADLSGNESEIESPGWHENALNETAASYAAGREKTSDWEEAKRNLRNEFE